MEDKCKSQPDKVCIKNVWRWRKYQKKVLKDKSRLVAVVKARQIGLTELASVMAITIALGSYKSDVWILGTNHEGAKELLWRAKAWYEALTLTTEGLPQIVKESTEQIIFDNKSRITALPNTARAIRGKTGTVIMDEAAHFANDEEIWTAFAPVISSNKKLRLFMFSTPFGQRGVFYRACHGLLDGKNLKWSVHKIDVHQAIKDGHSPDVLDLESSFTAEGWAQEFLCSFLSQEGKYLSASLIQRCYEAEIAEDEMRYVEKKVLGIDLASKKDMSITVECDWDGEKGFRIYNPTILSSNQNRLTYPEQYEIIKQMIRDKEYDKVIIDAAGPGAGLAQFLKKEFPNLIIEHTSTMKWKGEYIPALKFDMENDNIEIENNPILTTAFNSVQEKRTTANNIVYDLARDSTGHADAFAASLMAYSVYKDLKDRQPTPPRLVKRGSKAIRIK